MTASLNSIGTSATRFRANRFDKARAFFASRWPECGLALAMLAAVFVSGCHAYWWEDCNGDTRITSDPPESYSADQCTYENRTGW